MSELKQDTVGFAQYDSLRIEYADRLEEQAQKHREEIESQQELFIGMQNTIIETKEKDIKSWKVACIVSIVSLFLIISSLIGGALYLANTFEFETGNCSQDGDGFNNANLGTQGDVDYGASDTISENN